MACYEARQLQQWILQWSELMDFEIVPIKKSSDKREIVAPHLNSAPGKDHA